MNTEVLQSNATNQDIMSWLSQRSNKSEENKFADVFEETLNSNLNNKGILDNIQKEIQSSKKLGKDSIIQDDLNFKENVNKTEIIELLDFILGSLFPIDSSETKNDTDKINEFRDFMVAAGNVESDEFSKLFTKISELDRDSKDIRTKISDIIISMLNNQKTDELSKDLKTQEVIVLIKDVLKYLEKENTSNNNAGDYPQNKCADVTTSQTSNNSGSNNSLEIHFSKGEKSNENIVEISVQNPKTKIDTKQNTKNSLGEESLEKEIILERGRTNKPDPISLSKDPNLVDDKFFYKDTKPLDSFVIQNKSVLPEQKQVFDSILEQVNKAQINVKENGSEMNLQLKPDNLGSLSLKIAIEKGIVVAKIIAENQVVKEVLESNFNLLKDSLNEKGFSIQELSVSIGNDSNSRNNSNFSQRRQYKNLRIKANLNSQNNVLASLDKYSLLDSSIDFLA